MFNGVSLLTTLSLTRAVVEVGWFRSASVVPYLAALALSPIVAYLAMLPKSSIEEMGGMLFVYFPFAAVTMDLLLLLPNLWLRWRRPEG